MAENTDLNDTDILLHAYLKNRDEVCPSCRYNLRSLTGDTCPECGQRLRLQVGLVHPRLAAYITGLVGLAASMGFSGLLLGMLCFFVIFSKGWNDAIDDLIALIVGLVVSGSCLTVWLWTSRWLRRLTPSKQWMLVIVCWSIPAANLVMFIAVVV